MIRPGPEQGVCALIELFAARWTTLEFDRMSELWHLAAAAPTYVAVELHDPVVGWPALDEYWLRLAARVSAARVTTHGLRIDLVSPDLAWLYVTVDWDILTVDSPVRHRSETRATALLRASQHGRWQFLHLMEAPSAPRDVADASVGLSAGSGPEAS